MCRICFFIKIEINGEKSKQNTQISFGEKLRKRIRRKTNYDIKHNKQIFRQSRNCDFLAPKIFINIQSSKIPQRGHLIVKPINEQKQQHSRVSVYLITLK